MINPGTIWTYTVVIGRLNTAAMEAAGVYNDVLREPVLSDSDGDGVGETVREETELEVPAQIATDTWEKLRLAAGGLAPSTEIAIAFDREELEIADMLDTTGETLLRQSDRLIRVDDMDGVTIMTFPTDPNEDDYRPPLVATSIRPTGFMGAQNLVDVIFQQRDVFGGRFGS